MSTQSTPMQRSYYRDEWSAVSFAVFLILVGAFWLVYPSLWNEIARFFLDFRLVYVGRVPVFAEPVGNHSFLYGVATQFLIVMSLWLFALVAIRLYHHSSRRLISRTLTRAVFLLGLGFFSYELQIGSIPFRSIIPLIVVLAGATLIVRGLWNIFLVKTTV